MKRLLVLALIVMLPLLLLSATPAMRGLLNRMVLPGFEPGRNQWRLTESIEHFNDGMGWQQENKSVYFYNQNFPSRADSVQLWNWDYDFGNWMKSGASVFEFDSQGYVTSSTFNFAFFGIEFPFMRLDFLYDTQNRLTNANVYMAGDEDWTLMNRMQIVYVSNMDYTVYNWSASMDWRLGMYSRINFEWDAAGRIIGETEYTSPDSLTWTPIHRITRAYHANDTLNADQFVHWLAWHLPAGFMNFDDGFPGMITLESSYDHDGMGWYPSDRTTYDYDNANRRVQMFSQYWNFDEWTNNERNTYTYNAESNRAQDIREYWDEWMESWQEASLITYNWELYGTSNDDPIVPVNPGIRLSAYPSPFSETLNLRFESKAKSEVSFRIYNLRGQQVDAFKAMPNSVVNWKANRNLPSGVYFVKATQNGISQTTKVLKLK
ncbi:MAG: T9SS type A sorting domain-containing protein [Candidatus Cloacimonadaceae bacterium]|nr:T9SS type A sorting domain-containing protein [Candidatus Cloacimonadaceae bacterium]